MLLYVLFAQIGFQQGYAQKAFEIGGFTEAVVSVRSVSDAMKLYQDVGGWDIIGLGDADKTQAEFWWLPPSQRVKYAVLRNRGDRTGIVRLVEFENAKEQRQIRSSAYPWEPGGIFDLNIRVKDIAAKFAELQRRGWQGFSEPRRYVFDKFEVSEVLMRGPNGEVLALVERHAPPLVGFPNLREFSHVFNSSQIVSNMDSAAEFYMNKLGFKVYLKTDETSKAPEENIFGIPPNMMPSVRRRVMVLHPQGTNNGSVELISFEGVQGKNYARYAVPPNLGILALRFPVRHLDAFYKHLTERSVMIARPPAPVDMSPFGTARMLALRSPDGAWLEFYEITASNKATPK
jgi:catechol 2,3-dioxygenase-like lactoylglutathione lyase family enzyme